MVRETENTHQGMLKPVVGLEELLSRATDLVPRMVWIAREDGQRIFFNNKWLSFTGRTLAQESNNGWFENVHPSDAVQLRDTLVKSVSTRQPFNYEYRLRQRGGKYRLILDSGTPQYDDKGNFIGFVGFSTEVAESRATGCQIAVSVPEKLRTSSDTHANSPIGIWKLDLDLKVQKINQSVHAQLGGDASSIIGQPFGAVLSSLPKDALIGVISEQKRFRDTQHRIQLGLGYSTQATVWDVNLWPILSQGGTVVGACASTVEVLEWERMQQQTEEFVAALVHDLKTPLMGADRTLEALLNGAGGAMDPNQAKILSMLKRSNYFMLSMVQNLIEVQRYDQGKPCLNQEPISICELIRNTVTELSALAEDRGLSIQSSLPSGGGHMRADQTSLRRVFLNLIGNAIKFTNHGGRVRITGEENENNVTVFIEDNGIGIADSDQKQLFSRYFQGSRGRRYIEGTGLGLYLSKQIVEAHGGEISLFSKEGLGTTITVKLPRNGVVLI